MAAEDIVRPLIVGLSSGMILVLVSTGLTLTFGTMRILNMAHGAFYMVAAFLVSAFTTAATLGSGLVGFVLAMAAAIALTSVLGVALERTVYTRMYGRDEMSTLLLTFALMLVFQGIVQAIWGVTPRGVPLPSSLGGSTTILDVAIPSYNLVLIAVGVVALLALGAFLYGTRIGLETRVVAMDRSMASLLGIRVRRVFTLTFAAGCALAALGGTLVAPTIQVDPQLASTYIILAFAVVLVGGVGSVKGTLLAGLGLGIVNSFLAIHVAVLSGYGIYIAMLAVLALRPGGLTGEAA